MTYMLFDFTWGKDRDKHRSEHSWSRAGVRSMLRLKPGAGDKFRMERRNDVVPAGDDVVNEVK